MATIVYADGTLETGSNNGTSWANAYKGCAGLQTALDNVVNGSDTIVYIRNTFDVGAYNSTIDIDTAGGSFNANNWLQIIGCDANGIPLPMGQYVIFDGGNFNKNIIKIAGTVGAVKLKNIYAYRAGSTEALCFAHTSASYGFVVDNCKVESAAYGLKTGLNSKCLSVLNCLFVNCTNRGIYVLNNVPLPYPPLIYNCIFAGPMPMGIWASYGGNFINCIFRNIDTGISANNNGTFVIFGNTYYNDSESCVAAVSISAGTIFAYNNIFYLTDPAIGYPINRTGGSISFEDYNCTNAAVYTLTGVHSLNATDPQFVNAAGGDFRPRNPAVLRGGQPDIAGNLTEIGAIQSQHQFVSKARMSNFGRGSIFK
jgi:hypothetical protein